MKIAALQMVSTPEVARNLDAAAALIARAAAAGAQLVALPEYFCLMGRRDDDKLAIAAVLERRELHGPSLCRQIRAGANIPATKPTRARDLLQGICDST